MPHPPIDSPDGSLSQAQKDQALALAWRENRYEEARAWIALGADPLSEARPILSEALLNHNFERALELTPYRWNEPPGSLQGFDRPSPLMACLHLIYYQDHNTPEKPAAQVLARLLELGANPNERDDRPGAEALSPLFYAASYNAVHAAGLLIDHGANLSETYHGRPGDKFHPGDTALHAAVRCWDSDMATLLIARGADRFAKNDQGLTPQELIAQVPAIKPRERLGALFAQLERQDLDAAALPSSPSARPAFRV